MIVEELYYIYNTNIDANCNYYLVNFTKINKLK